MWPVLIAVGPIKIYSMGVLLALGLFFGLYHWWRLGRDEHFEEDNLFDAYFLGIVAFFVIGRVGYVAMHLEDLGTLYRVLAFLKYPGLAYGAGVGGAVASVMIYARSKSWEMWKVLDMVAVTVMYVLIFGSLGALLNGSNPGKEMAIGLIFPGLSGRRFPVDFWGVVIFAVAAYVVAKCRKNFRFYSWYKGENGVAKEGLAALTAGIFVGVYYLVVGLADDNLAHVGAVSLVSIGGIVLMLGAIALILSRMDRTSRDKLIKRITRQV